MSTNNAALALVVDRSGSMHSIASDVIGSVKQFIGAQKKESGKASLTVVQFDHAYEVIIDFKDIQEVNEEEFTKSYTPRGLTALLDAIGRTTLAMKQKLESMPAAERPNKIVVAVITDGLENASTEFSLDKINELIKQHEALGWNFMFLGASRDAIVVAQKMGFCSSKSAVYDVDHFKESMNVINEQMTKARHGLTVEICQAQRNSIVASA